MDKFIKSSLTSPPRNAMFVPLIRGLRANRVRLMFVFFAMTMSFSAQAAGLICNFTGPNNGSWTIAANWSCSDETNTVPGTGDTANVVNKIVRVLASASAIGNNVLLMSSTGTAKIIIEAGGSLTLGTVNVVGPASSIENSGFVDLGSDITSSGVGARFNNLPGGTVEASSYLNIDILFDNKGLASFNGVTLADATKFSQTDPSATLNFNYMQGTTGTLTLAAGSVRSVGGGGPSLNFSNVVNTGATIYPSPDGESTGGIYIGGNYQQSGSGKLSLLYCSDPFYPNYDSIYFSNATLGGIVQVISVCDTPLAGENFTPIASSGDISGTFASVVRLPAGAISADYSSGDSVKFTFGTPPPPQPIMTVAVSPSNVAPSTNAIVTLTLSTLLGSEQFIDDGYINMPPGLLVQTSPAPETTCLYDYPEISPPPTELKSAVQKKPGGLMSVGIGGGGSSLNFNSGRIPANGSCTVTFNVQAANIGTYAITVLPGNLYLDTPPYYSNINTSTAVLSVVPPGPSIDVNLGSVDFGRQGVGITSTVQPVIVTNIGTTPLTLTGFTISGDFGYTSNCPISPATLLSGDTCNVYISFTPLTPAALSGRFAVNSDAVFGNSSTLLYGQGVTVPIPNISLSANSLSFGDQAIGSISSIQSVVVTNTGTATLFISNIALNSAAVSAGFTLIAGRADPVPPNPPIAATTPGCGGSVPPAGSCFVSVIFSPTGLGMVPGAASLNITHNATATGIGTTIRNVGLTANGTPRREPSIRVIGGNSGTNNANLNFAEQVIGTAGSPQQLSITNTGTANLSISSVVVVPTNGTTNAGDFTLGGSCATAIVPNASCGLTISFSPLAPIGTKAANLVITSNASNATQPAGTTSVRLGGLAAAVPVPIVRLNPTTIGFGTGLLGAPTTQRLTVSNVGQLPLNVTRINLTGEDYSQTNDCSSPLNPTQSCTINVTFSPQRIGSRPGTLTITSNATPTTNAVPLTGTGCVFVPLGAGRFILSPCGN